MERYTTLETLIVERLAPVSPVLFNNNSIHALEVTSGADERYQGRPAVHEEL